MKVSNKLLRMEALFLVSIFLFSFFPEKRRTTERASSAPASITSHEAQLKGFQDKTVQMGFIENKGQLRKGEDVAYYIQQRNLGIYFKKTGISYIWIKEDPTQDSSNLKGLTPFPKIAQKRMDMQWEGSNPQVQIRASQVRPDLRHYYTGNDSEGLTHIRNFGEILYEDLYPHIDMRMYFKENQLKYDFIVKPGGKVADIQLCYSGQDTMLHNSDGSIEVKHAWGSLEEGTPISYQVIDGDTSMVSSWYHLTEDQIQFETKKYNHAENLVIDPTLEWGTYYGGSNTERSNAVYTDDVGNVYIAGVVLNGHYNSSYTNFPSSGHDHTMNGDNDAFLIKFDASGNRQWATYYGGNDEDYAWSVCTDQSGDVYMAGVTHSNTDIAENGHDETYNESNPGFGNRFNRDAFLVKFSEDGTRIWGTYYGGEDPDAAMTGDSKAEEGRAVGTDSNGNVYLAGFTSSEEYIAWEGHDNSYNGGYDAFLVKFDSDGDREWATYFGKDEWDSADAIAIDDWDNVYIAGHTESDALAFKALHDDTYSGDSDGFLAKFSPEGRLYWCNYIGGDDMDRAHSIDTYLGYVYVAGITKSDNGIARWGHDNTYNGEIDAFLIQFGFLGNRLWGTYYGGVEDEGIRVQEADGGYNYWRTSSVAVSKNSDLYLSGSTLSNSHIATNNGYDPTFNGGKDAFLVRFLQNGDRQWGSYYGGESDDYAMACTTDPWAKVYITGATRSPNGIALNGHDNSFEDSEGTVYSDAFLAKFYPYGTTGDPDGPPEVDPNDPEDPYPSRPGANSSQGSDVGNWGGTRLRVFPNPTVDEVQLYFPGLRQTSYQVSIHDIRGNLVYKQTELSGIVDQQIDVSKLPKGMYVVSLQSAEESFSEKLLIE